MISAKLIYLYDGRSKACREAPAGGSRYAPLRCARFVKKKMISAKLIYLYDGYSKVCREAPVGGSRHALFALRGDRVMFEKRNL